MVSGPNHHPQRQVAEGHHPRGHGDARDDNQWRASLAGRLWECFFGFSNQSMEDHFIQNAIGHRKHFMLMACAFATVASTGKLFKLGWNNLLGWNTFSTILLAPTTPIPVLLLVFALATGQWRWVEPLHAVISFSRALSLTIWLAQAPASLLPEVQWLGTGPFSSSKALFAMAVFSVFGSLRHVRFKYGSLQALFWVAMAPAVARRSTADLYIWPLLLFPSATVVGRLVLELRGRARFMSRYYPPTTSKKLGNEPLGQAETEMSDQELAALVEDIYSGFYSLLVAPRQTRVFLRIPDADPDDLTPGAKERLQHRLEAQFPGYYVSDITFQRGSLLVGFSLADAPDAEARGTEESSEKLVQDISHNTWLSWLGLPTDMDMSVQVSIPTDRQVNLLDGFPFAVSVPKYEQEFYTVSFPLRCSDVPKDVAFKASIGCHVLACDVLVCSADEGEPFSSPAVERSYITLQVNVPMQVLSASPCWLMKVNVQSLSDRLIVGDRNVVLLLDQLTQLEPELCSMRLLRPPIVAPSHARRQQYGADVAFAFGWWLQTMHVEHQHGDHVHEDGKDVEETPSKQVTGMWKTGINLLMLLVGDGCNTIAQHVIDLLLNSSALRPCINTKMWYESMERFGTFQDFMSGAMIPRGFSMLHLAVLSGSYAMVDEVLRWTAAYNLPCRWDARDSAGMTPLHLAQLVNDGQMATYLLRKQDPLILHAWHHNSGEHAGGSPEQFQKRMGKLTARMERGGRDRSTSHRTRTGHRDIHVRDSMLRGHVTSKPAPAFAPAITPAPAGALGVPTGQLGVPVGQCSSTMGVPAGQCSSTMGVPAGQCSSNDAQCQTQENLPSPPPHAACSPSVLPEWLSITVAPNFLSHLKQLCFSMKLLPNSQEEQNFSMYRIEKRATSIRLASLLRTLAYSVMAVRGKGSALSLAMAALICCLQLPLLCSIAKRDYATVEKQIFACMLARSFVYVPFFYQPGGSFLILPIRVLTEPVRLRWVMIGMLFKLMGICVAYQLYAVPLHFGWWLLSAACELLLYLLLRLYDRTSFPVCDKS